MKVLWQGLTGRSKQGARPQPLPPHPTAPPSAQETKVSSESNPSIAAGEDGLAVHIRKLQATDMVDSLQLIRVRTAADRLYALGPGTPDSQNRQNSPPCFNCARPDGLGILNGPPCLLPDRSRPQDGGRAACEPGGRRPRTEQRGAAVPHHTTHFGSAFCAACARGECCATSQRGLACSRVLSVPQSTVSFFSHVPRRSRTS